MTEERKKLLFTLLRVVVCVVALAYVLHGVTLQDSAELADGRTVRLLGETPTSVTVLIDGQDVALLRDQLAIGEDGSEKITYGLYGAIRRSNPKILLLCLVVFTPVVFLQSLRFKWLLRAQEIHIAYWEAVKLSFAGNFLNFFALGSTGGDVAKAYYISLHTDRKTEAVTTVVLDRVIGLAGLLTTVGLVILLCTRNPQLLAVGYAVAAVWLGLMFAALLLSSERLRSWLASVHLIRRLISLGAEPSAGQGAAPGRLRRLAAWGMGQGYRADKATRRLLRHKSLVLGALAATILLQLFAVCDFVLVCYAMDMDFSGGKMWDYYAVTSTGNIVAAVPISLQGLGTTEATYKHFLLDSHASLSQILCMAMAIRLLHLIWAMPGLLVTMTGAYKPRPEAAAAASSSASVQ